MNRPPYTVTVLGFDHALSSAITGALDIFAFAGISWQRIHQQPTQPLFKVQVASFHGKPITCSNQLVIEPHIAIQDVQETHILLIPTIGGDIQRVLSDLASQYVHIRRLYKRGADVAGNCTGVFILAEAGLLDQRTATTHWGYAQLFKDRFPEVDLQTEKMVTEQNSLYCAGGGMAWIDLALLLIERYCGHQVASDTAKSHVLDISRPNQTVYASSRQRKFHQDQDILAVQSHLEENYAQHLTISMLAKHFNLTDRTLLRRFKLATGITPLQYLQSVRLEHARKLLEGTGRTLDVIVTSVGYDDTSTFSRLFKRKTGLSPSQYRAKFVRHGEIHSENAPKYYKP